MVNFVKTKIQTLINLPFVQRVKEFHLRAVFNRLWISLRIWLNLVDLQDDLFNIFQVENLDFEVQDVRGVAKAGLHLQKPKTTLDCQNPTNFDIVVIFGVQGYIYARENH
jgi:hypothetical protein